MGKIILGLTLFLSSSFAFSHDDWPNRHEVAWAAHDFSYESDHFHETVHWVTGYSHLASDAHRLAQDTEHFHLVVEGGAPYDHVINDYQRLDASYQHLRNAFYAAHRIYHDPHLIYDWQDVEYAYNGLRNAMYWHLAIPVNGEPGRETDFEDLTQ